MVRYRDTVPDRDTEVLLAPSKDLLTQFGIVVRHPGDNVDVIVRGQRGHSLVEPAGVVDDPVAQRDEQHRPLNAILPVIYPLDHRQQRMEDRLVVKIVLAVEPDRLRIMSGEQIECVYQGVALSVKPENLVLVLRSPFEAMRADLPEMFQKGFCDQKRCLAILTRVMELLPSQPIVFQQRVRQLKRRVHKNPVHAVQHFRVHRPH